VKAHPKTTYNRLNPPMWAYVRAAYLSGLSAPAVAARFGVSVAAIRKRASREGWTKASAASVFAPVTPDAFAADAFAADACVPGPLAPDISRPDLLAGVPDLTDVLDRLYPHTPTPAGLMQRALDEARRALGEGDGLTAHRLARAADAIQRLETWRRRRLEDLPRDEADELEAEAAAEAAAERRTEMLRLYVVEAAAALARDLAAGRPIPDDYRTAFERLKPDGSEG